MAKSTANLTTPNARRYLQQLCKHFGHKVPVKFTPTEGQVTLPFGDCHLTADATALSMEVEGNVDAIHKLEAFISTHLERFAFRETPTLTWTETPELKEKESEL